MCVCVCVSLFLHWVSNATLWRLLFRGFRFISFRYSFLLLLLLCCIVFFLIWLWRRRIRAKICNNISNKSKLFFAFVFLFTAFFFNKLNVGVVENEMCSVLLLLSLLLSIFVLYRCCYFCCWLRFHSILFNFIPFFYSTSSSFTFITIYIYKLFICFWLI